MTDGVESAESEVAEGEGVHLIGGDAGEVSYGDASGDWLTTHQCMQRGKKEED